MLECSCSSAVDAPVVDGGSADACGVGCGLVVEAEADAFEEYVGCGVLGAVGVGTLFVQRLRRVRRRELSRDDVPSASTYALSTLLAKSISPASSSVGLGSLPWVRRALSRAPVRVHLWRVERLSPARSHAAFWWRPMRSLSK